MQKKKKSKDKKVHGVTEARVKWWDLNDFAVRLSLAN